MIGVRLCDLGIPLPDVGGELSGRVLPIQKMESTGSEPIRRVDTYIRSYKDCQCVGTHIDRFTGAPQSIRPDFLRAAAVTLARIFQLRER